MWQHLLGVGKKTSAVNIFYNEENYIHYSSTKCETAQVKRGLNSPLSNRDRLGFRLIKTTAVFGVFKK